MPKLMYGVKGTLVFEWCMVGMKLRRDIEKEKHIMCSRGGHISPK